MKMKRKRYGIIHDIIVLLMEKIKEKGLVCPFSLNNDKKIFPKTPYASKLWYNVEKQL